MMTLAEKLAAKKEAQRLAALGATATTATTATTVAVEEEKVEEKKVEEKPAAAVQQNLPQQTLEQIAAMQVPTVDSTGKPLSGFALVKARKEQAARLALLQQQSNNNQQDNVQIQAPSPVPTVAVAPATPDTAESAVGNEPVMQEIIHNAVEENAEHEDKINNATPETRQAYSDVKERLDKLVSVSGDDLRGEMALLKKALMQNPNAVELMLPSDIGQMVIALRKMTGVELAAVKEGKKNGTAKKKEVPLTAEQLEAAWEEL